MKTFSPWMSSLALVAILGLSLGCARKPDDAKVSSEIQSKFNLDSGLSTKQLTVQAKNGVVTLNGYVDNDAQREAASRQAASVAGVKTVVNNLQVGVAPPDATTPTAKNVPASAPATSSPISSSTHTPAADRSKPAAGKKSKAPDSANSAPQNSSDDPAQSHLASNQITQPVAIPDNPSATTPEATPDNTPAAATTPAPPSSKKLIIDQGTQIAVRLIDPIDTSKNQTGDTFHATLNAPLTSDGEVAVPAGTELTGHIVDLKNASKFSGQSLIVLQLDSVSSGSQIYNLHTDQYRKEGSSRGKNTAEKVGGGAVLGSIIGAIAGGGKGAAIGGAAGAGAGGGVQAAGKSQEIKLPSETVLNFVLQEPITVTQPPSTDAPRLKLVDSQQ
jgi:BON domain